MICFYIEEFSQTKYFVICVSQLRIWFKVFKLGSGRNIFVTRIRITGCYPCWEGEKKLKINLQDTLDNYTQIKFWPEKMSQCFFFWFSDEGITGSGKLSWSRTVRNTELNNNNILTCMDIPYGDWNIMRQVCGNKWPCPPPPREHACIVKIRRGGTKGWNDGNEGGDTYVWET